MSRLRSAPDECVILVKALPHRSSDYFETVCCAGVGHDLKWRRLYPVPFRVLDAGQQFGRWDWVKYSFTPPAHDARRESQKVDPGSIRPKSQMKPAERGQIARRLTRLSTAEAEAAGDSLTLIKPSAISFSWRRKSASELDDEKGKHAKLAGQLSLLNREAKPLEPCPYEFTFTWRDQLGRRHVHTCDDWETTTAFSNRKQSLGEEGGLRSLKTTYEDEYMAKGIRLALGTHSRRSNQWLLVGILRVDESSQTELIL